MNDVDQFFSHLLTAREEMNKQNEADDLALELEARNMNESFERDREAIDTKQALFDSNQALRREAIADQRRKQLKNLEFSLLNK